MKETNRLLKDESQSTNLVEKSKIEWFNLVFQSFFIFFTLNIVYKVALDNWMGFKDLHVKIITLV